MQFTKRVLTAAATGAILFSSFATTAFASTTDITISGNGSTSNNTVNVSSAQNTTAVQSNTAIVTNTVNSTSSTGNNNADANTGGDVTVRTGAASSTTNVSTTANANTANLNNCNCEGSTNVTISGNGTGSTNNATVANGNGTALFQTNAAVITNNVNNNAKTGDNSANANTGGDVTIATGGATANSTVANLANANVATQGTGLGSAGQTSSVVISGNGSGSKNTISLAEGQSTLLVQSNSAIVTNVVNSNAKTGDNDANANTGGDVTITTGPAASNANVWNMVNFNVADLDCGCVTDLLVKVSGNGTDSYNKISANLGDGSAIFQGAGNGGLGGNLALLTNVATANSGTGYNGASANTGPVLDDPVVIWTGEASNTTNVSNSGNVNVIGSSTWTLPTGLNFTFSLGGLLGLLHMV